jgi:putative peptidoglycan lipid II flippase
MNVETVVWFDMTLWERVVKLLGLVLVGVIVYFSVLILSGMNIKQLVKGVGE